MTNSHTPGPWTIATPGTYVRIDAPKGNKHFPHGQPIAQVSSGPGKCAVENARLIAAAPDLLRELETAVRILNLNGFEDHAESARAAIAKACGES